MRIIFRRPQSYLDDRMAIDQLAQRWVSLYFRQEKFAWVKISI
jgi:hypothetical protein